MKNKAVWMVAAALATPFFAAPARAAGQEAPVWQQLETYSKKDKSYVEARKPKLEKVEKEIEKIRKAASTKGPTAGADVSKLEAERVAILGDLAKHEYTLSTEVAEFANGRSREAEAKLQELGAAAPAAEPAAPDPAAPEALQTGPQGLQGAKQKLVDDFEEQVAKDRAILEEELKQLPPDADETAREELKEKLRRIAAEEEEKIRAMPPGPKRQRRDAFDEKVKQARAELMAQLKSQDAAESGAAAPPAPQA